MPKLPTIILAAAALASCATVPAPSATPAAYHALGTEPGWTLTIGERLMHFSGPYGQGPVSEPTPRVIHGFAGEIWQGKRIRVNVVHGRCSDGMSDRVYSDSVQLGVDGKAYRGCGGAIKAE
jgi:heat shock protein HslJ